MHGSDGRLLTTRSPEVSSLRNAQPREDKSRRRTIAHTPHPAAKTAITRPPGNALFLLLLAALCLALFPHPAAADHVGFVQNADYNNMRWGNYVRQSYKTFHMQSPILNFMKPFTECDDGSLIMIAPRGADADPGQPFVLDHTGAMVWTPDKPYGQVYNLQLQHYKGEDYLCFWAGNDAIGGHGVGKVYMFDKHYDLFRTVIGANGLGLDLHTFDILENGHAIFTVYDIVSADLRGIHHKHGPGFIWDSLFQEIDMETNEVIFQWRASEHIPLRASYAQMNKATSKDPWDWFHINSVEKDRDGNYLISARYIRAMVYISGETGEVIWWLGGRHNSFEDLSNGLGTSFLGQHDAHWIDEPSYHAYLTVFDNRGDWAFHTEHESRGSRIALDLENMTATMDMMYMNAGKNIYSTSQGSFQTLPNGHVLLGYGFNGVITEYSPDGDILCDAYFEPAGKFTSGAVQSYRNLKFNWTGIPSAPPVLVLEEEPLPNRKRDMEELPAHDVNGPVSPPTDSPDKPPISDVDGFPDYDYVDDEDPTLPHPHEDQTPRPVTFYVSWMGTTETRQWQLSDSFYDPDDPNDITPYEPLVTFPKQGFETSFPLSPNLRIKRFVRVSALDAEGTVLKTSQSLDIGTRATFYEEDIVLQESEINELLQDWDEDSSLDPQAPSSSSSDAAAMDQLSLDQVHEDLQNQVTNLQLLVGFGFIAFFSTIAVAWLTLGTRRIHGLVGSFSTLFTPAGAAATELEKKSPANPDKQGGLSRAMDVAGERLLIFGEGVQVHFSRAWAAVEASPVGRYLSSRGGGWSRVPIHDGGEGGDVDVPRVMVDARFPGHDR